MKWILRILSVAVPVIVLTLVIGFTRITRSHARLSLKQMSDAIFALLADLSTLALCPKLLTSDSTFLCSTT
jgi:hypothetical protein